MIVAIIDNVTYDKVSNLKVVYEGDIFAYSYPISKMTVRVKTTDNLSNANIVRFHYSNAYYMPFFVRNTKKINDNEWEIEGEDWASEFDRINMPAVYYADEPVSDILDVYEQCFYNSAFVNSPLTLIYSNSVAGQSYTKIDNLTGVYFPAQTLRERLITIAFITNCVIREYYDGVMLVHISQIQIVDPVIYGDDVIFKKPKLDILKPTMKVYMDHYVYTQKSKSNIASGDRYVIVKPMTLVIDSSGIPHWEKDTGGSTKYYVYTSDTYAVGYYGVTEGDEISLNIPSITDNYYQQIATRLAQLYIDFWIDENHQPHSVLRNNQITFTIKEQLFNSVANTDRPLELGKLITVVCDNKMYTGYLTKITTTYGSEEPSNQYTPVKKIELVVSCARQILSCPLDIVYKYMNSIDVKKKSYRFPDGYQYNIGTEYQDLLFYYNGINRHILKPDIDGVRGTLNTPTTEYVGTSDAIIQRFYENSYQQFLELQIEAVDDVTYDDIDGYLYIN